MWPHVREGFFQLLQKEQVAIEKRNSFGFDGCHSAGARISSVFFRGQGGSPSRFICNILFRNNHRSHWRPPRNGIWGGRRDGGCRRPNHGTERLIAGG